MTKVKMPEPDGYMPYPFGHIGCYSEDEMKQYGDDRAREALEIAANRVAVWDKSFNTGGAFADAIRALAKEIK